MPLGMTTLLQEVRIALFGSLSTSLAVALLAGCAVDVGSEDTATAVGEPRPIDTDEEPDGVIGDPIAAGPQVVVTEGDMCVYANEPPFFPGTQQLTVLGEGDVLVVQVTLPGCLSSTCTMDRVASCRIVQDGRQLVVESSFGYVPLQGPSCTKDCVTLFATCESEPLAEGSYDLIHGDDVTPLQVPSRGEACGVGPSDGAP